MLTRIMFLIAVIGLIILFFGISNDDTIMMIIGLGAVVVGLIGVNQSARNKKGMGLFGWIWKRL